VTFAPPNLHFTSMTFCTWTTTRSSLVCCHSGPGSLDTRPPTDRVVLHPILNQDCRAAARTCCLLKWLQGVRAYRPLPSDTIMPDTDLLRSSHRSWLSWQVDHLSPARCGLAWSPDGSMVAVPGHEHDVVCYERLNWKPLLTLRGEHTARVNLVAFAPDGTALSDAPQPPASLARARSAKLVLLR